jgi:glycerol-3-phosphate acyltransferase PlsY
MMTGSGVTAAWPSLLSALALGYLFGSVPFGLLLTRIFGAPDIRSIGSGNIGATNVLRTGRKGLAAATLLCDILKGTAAVLLAQYLFGAAGALAGGLGAFLGHLFPVWLRFRGGKGVATFIGVLLGFSWIAVVAFALVWLALAALTRYSSLSGMTACAATPLILWGLGLSAPALLFLVLAMLVIVTHRANIARLVGGTETKIGQPAVKP